ncbi:MAG: hypothetical protein V3V09_05720 [Arenicellales bacterium]
MMRSIHPTIRALFRLSLILLGLFTNVAMLTADERPSPETQACVVILHGMGRTHHSMGKIQTHLEQAGYAVSNASYPSTTEPIETLTELAVGQGIKHCQQLNAPVIHFVTHSLGGILVRAYLQDHVLSELGKIIMLAPPNHGSEIVDVLKDYRVYHYAMGPAGQALSTSNNSLPNQLKPIQGEIGIIAGNYTSDPWFSPLIPGEDDGKVSVESAKLDEMQDFWVIDSGHSFIMRNTQVIEQIVYFLKHGRFR